MYVYIYIYIYIYLCSLHPNTKMSWSSNWLSGFNVKYETGRHLTKYYVV